MIGVSNSWEESTYGKGSSLVLLLLCYVDVGRYKIGKIKMFDDCKNIYIIIIMWEAAAAVAAKSLQNTHQNVAVSRFWAGKRYNFGNNVFSKKLLKKCKFPVVTFLASFVKFIHCTFISSLFCLVHEEGERKMFIEEISPLKLYFPKEWHLFIYYKNLWKP